MGELKKLRTHEPDVGRSDGGTQLSRLDAVHSVEKRTKIKQDIKLAERILDADHYGLEKVKERIIEYLAVQQRTVKVKGPILCLVGPPGVGKTSLGRSIAQATGRNFVRVSLGGVRDESEIRGHRRTYIGSMPGKIIQGMKKAKASNPLFLLDEVDKLGADWRGDPASALLEVLDPEQNVAFNDHYLEVDYDLSDVMFVTTANTLAHAATAARSHGDHSSRRLYRRREGRHRQAHLLDKQIKAAGLKKGEWSISDDALRDLIRYYTREAGVRNLEREIANLARKATKEILSRGLPAPRSPLPAATSRSSPGCAVSATARSSSRT